MRTISMLIATLISAALTMPSLPGLPDFSRAGHEHIAPAPAKEVSITDFGAHSDDGEGDAHALQEAIDAVSLAGGIVRVPAGRWILDEVVNISDDRVQVVGERGTVLVCPKSLAQIFGPNRNWSWSGGLLRLAPEGSTHVLGRVAQASDGADVLPVEWSDPTVAARSGEWVQLQWYNDKEDTLLAWLYGQGIPPSKYGSEFRGEQTVRIRTWTRVVSVEGGRVKIDPPLPAPISDAWRVEMVRTPSLQQVVLRDLRFEFPDVAHAGHLKEPGYNAIQATRLLQCSIERITTVNADSAVFLGNSAFTTVRHLRCLGRRMHHPVSLSWSSHCLVEHFDIDAPHVHGTTISWGAHFNVFTDGSGTQLAMDSHRACSFRNLHQRITCRQGDSWRQPLRSGGSYNRGPHAARENVYWDVSLQFDDDEGIFAVRGHEEWPLGIFVGWRSNRTLNMAPRLPGQVVAGLNARPAGPSPWGMKITAP